jgi:hypothetical protein
MQSPEVELPLGAVGNATFHVLQRTGHGGLAVPLQDRQADQEIGFHDGPGHLDGKAVRLLLHICILLHVDKIHAIGFHETLVSVDLEGAGGAVTYPGRFDDADAGKSTGVEIGDRSLDDFRVGRRAAVRSRAITRFGFNTMWASF